MDSIDSKIMTPEQSKRLQAAGEKIWAYAPRGGVKPKPPLARGIDAARRHYLDELAKLERSQWDAERNTLLAEITEIVGTAMWTATRDEGAAH
jgi:hypothetical protein